MNVDKILYKAAMYERRANHLISEAVGMEEPMEEGLLEGEPTLEGSSAQELVEANNLLVKEVEATLDKLSAEYEKLEISNLSSINEQMIFVGEAPLLTGQIINVYGPKGTFGIFFGLEKTDLGMSKYYYLYNGILSVKELQKNMDKLEYIYEGNFASTIKNKFHAYTPYKNIGEMLKHKAPHLFSKKPVSNIESSIGADTFEDDE